jgi:hypothetical protein
MKQKRFDVLIKTPKRFTSNVEAFLNGLFTALPDTRKSELLAGK